MAERNKTDCIVVPMALLTDRRLSASAKLMYGLIAHYQKVSGGFCQATNRELAAVYNDCTISSLQRLIKELRDGGYIEIVHISGKVRKIRTLI